MFRIELHLQKHKGQIDEQNFTNATAPTGVKQFHKWVRLGVWNNQKWQNN
jgi:hypothetical protein